jgi:hypothetical protein
MPGKEEKNKGTESYVVNHYHCSSYFEAIQFIGEDVILFHNGLRLLVVYHQGEGSFMDAEELVCSWLYTNRA